MTGSNSQISDSNDQQKASYTSRGRSWILQGLFCVLAGGFCLNKTMDGFEESPVEKGTVGNLDDHLATGSIARDTFQSSFNVDVEATGPLVAP